MSASPSPPAPAFQQDAQLLALIALAHGMSHFSQLLLPPLFPWLKEAFDVSYTELGAVLSVFFIASCVAQTLSGFWVDRFGPRPVLYGGLGLLLLSALGYATAPSYAWLLVWGVVAGLGNGVFHPVDYTLINRKIHASRLGHAYSTHGISGSLGWALAPALLVPLAAAYGWRVALFAGAALVGAVLLLLALQPGKLALGTNEGLAPPSLAAAAAAPAREGEYDFLRIPSVWMCFAFFFLYAAVLSVIQAFAPEAARQMHQVPVHLVAICLSVYMVGAACGMVGGGFLATDPARCERIVALGLGLAALLALSMALAAVPAALVPLLFAAMGLCSGMASPSRDLLVKQSTPPQATGRVYGVVYAGLDIGQAVTPLLFGRLMDWHQYQGVWIGVAMLQLTLVATAFRVRHTRRVALAPA